MSSNNFFLSGNSEKNDLIEFSNKDTGQQRNKK